MRQLARLDIWLALALAGVVLATSGVAHGQDAEGDEGMGRDEAAAPEGGEPAGDEEDVDADADVEVRKEGDKTVTVIRFSGLDISGDLKSPQLLYFLTRLRAEFDRPKLPHRSFIPELLRSSHGEEF